MDSPGGKKDVVRISGIDLGTNTALLLVADIAPDGAISRVSEALNSPGSKRGRQDGQNQ